MRWFRFGQGKRQVDHDPALRRDLLQRVRAEFGPQIRVAFPDQVAAAVRLLDGDDGLLVAGDIVREFADSAHADIVAQAADLRHHLRQDLAFHRRNYRPLWRATQGHLRWTLFALPCGWFPYVHITAAASVIASRAARAVDLSAPEPLLAHLFEILDLTIDGWEYGRIRVDTDAVALTNHLVLATQQLREALGSPPPLPPPVRELMRRNNSLDVCDSSGTRLVGAINPGKHLRESLLI